MATTIFAQQAERYDAWYDTAAGATIWAEELAALRPLVADLPHPWLEVGIGSGRFAAALGAEVGIDPARAPLVLARHRGCQVAVAAGEALPFRAETFGAVLFVVTLCFVADPLMVLSEARRVLRPEGGVVLGLVPAEGPWGQHYRQLADEGDPFYRSARFWTRGEIAGLLAAVQLVPTRTRTALFWPPGASPRQGGAREGDDRAAGFMAQLAARLVVADDTAILVHRDSGRTPML